MGFDDFQICVKCIIIYYDLNFSTMITTVINYKVINYALNNFINWISPSTTTVNIANTKLNRIPITPKSVPDDDICLITVSPWSQFILLFVPIFTGFYCYPRFKSHSWPTTGIVNGYIISFKSYFWGIFCKVSMDTAIPTNQNPIKHCLVGFFCFQKRQKLAFASERK